MQEKKIANYQSKFQTKTPGHLSALLALQNQKASLQ